MTLVSPASLTSSSLLPATAHDRYFDYCLEPYRPRRSFEGKIRSENLLWQSLRTANALPALGDALRAIQSHVGRDLTVWGVKWDGQRTWWELYFYDPRKESAAATITSLRAVVAPWIEIVPSLPETVPYMMVSFDLTAAGTGKRHVPDFNVYLTGEKAHAGRSYKIHADRIELENTYKFMEPKRSIDDVLPLVRSSAFVDYSDPRVLSKVLIPELFACKKVCVSKKRTCDAIYFSGIDVHQLTWFLAKFDYPAATRELVDRQRDALEHLWFDVGIDYRQRGDGGIAYLKTSYYGTI